MGRIPIWFCALLLFGLVGCLPTGEGTTTFESARIPILGVHNFERAIQANQKVLVLDNQPGELIWLTGFTVSPESLTEGDQFSNTQALLGATTIGFQRSRRHAELLGVSWAPYTTIFGVVGGHHATQLPSGFGIPMFSNEPLLLRASVINLDPYFPASQIKLQGNLSFVRQRGLAHKMKPLLARRLSLLSPLSPAAPVWNEHTFHGPIQPFPKDPEVEYQDVFFDRFGQAFGKYLPVSKEGGTFRGDVTKLLALKPDSQVHFASAVVHPEVERISLIRQSDEVRLIELKVLGRSSDGNVSEMATFSSPEGLELHKDERYWLEIEFPPSSSQEGRRLFADLFVYLGDPDFQPPTR